MGDCRKEGNNVEFAVIGHHMKWVGLLHSIFWSHELQCLWVIMQICIHVIIIKCKFCVLPLSCFIICDLQPFIEEACAIVTVVRLNFEPAIILHYLHITCKPSFIVKYPTALHILSFLPIHACSTDTSNAILVLQSSCWISVFLILSPPNSWAIPQTFEGNHSTNKRRLSATSPSR